MKSFVLVIIGPPAAGKTTISKALSKELKAVHLQEDHFNGAQRWRKFKAAETNQLSLDCLLAVTKVCLKQGHAVIIEGIFAREESKVQLLQWDKKLSARVIMCYLQVDLPNLQTRNNLADRGKVIKEKNVIALSAKLDDLYGSDHRVHQAVNSTDDPTEAVAAIRLLVGNQSQAG